MRNFQRVFRLGPASFKLTTDDPALLRLLQSEFEDDFRWGGANADLHIEFILRRPGQNPEPLFAHEVLPLKKTHFKLARERHIDGWILGNLLHLEDGEHFLDLDYSQGKARGVFSPSIFDTPRLITHTYFLVTLIELLRTQGVYYLHGGAMVRPGGEDSILLLGDGGVGKSTTCSLLLKQGWRLVGDDALILSVGRRGQVEVHPLLQRLLIDPALLHSFPGMLVSRIEEPGKAKVKLSSLPRMRTARVAQPSSAFVLKADHSGVSSLQPVSKSAFIAELVRQNLFLFLHPMLAEHHLSVLTKLAKQCAVHQLTLGGDILREPSRLEALLDENALTKPAAASL